MKGLSNIYKNDVREVKMTSEESDVTNSLKESESEPIEICKESYLFQAKTQQYLCLLVN